LTELTASSTKAAIDLHKQLEAGLTGAKAKLDAPVKSSPLTKLIAEALSMYSEDKEDTNKVYSAIVELDKYGDTLFCSDPSAFPGKLEDYIKSIRETYKTVSSHNV
jgi:hypothetical protein